MNSDYLSMSFSELSKDQIELSLNKIKADRSTDVFVFDEIGSTNQWLIDHLPETEENDVLCVAESQSLGRGRSGRYWVSPSDSNIYMSFSYRVVTGRRDMSALSLVIGVSLVRVLKSKGVFGVSLKWPNDVILNGKKLAGVLIESKSSQGRLYLVIGVGVNVRMPADVSIESDMGWIDLSNQCIGLVDRNNMIALIYNESRKLIDQFFNEGFVALREEWMACDEFANREVKIVDSGRVMIVGKNIGVDNSGCLLIRTESGIKKVITGDVSLRSKDED